MDDARGWGETRLNRSKVLRWALLHAAALVGGALFFSWSAVAVAAALLGVTMCLGVSVGIHRGLIHRAFQTSRPVEAVLAVLGTLAGLGGVLGMSRMHHMRDYHQNQPDCPPYFGYRGGFLETMAYALFFDYRAPDASIYPPVEPRVAARPLFQHLERAGLWLQVPLALALYAVGGPAFVAWGIFIRLALTQDGFWAIHYVSHVAGEQPYELVGAAEQGRNAGWLALLSMGEAWHNTHHAYPASAQMGVGWRQPDPGFWAVRALEALGLVWGVRTVADLPLREGARRVHARSPRHARRTRVQRPAQLVAPTR
ncbi:acyl-CoA desaturase [Hyalangium rubrum]|uniref:Acyl-CoA desaturase n=1 Tax=Hyalangium rubrum TaxID=3103134 RepID=A0ABU5GZ93_9BACT|nr:acyl-CoA desaturase [Hyalangium sp. s54d21]MDY7226207.1 acyl-CoA desaturase [Hyalangium sp. s54d21]